MREPQMATISLRTRSLESDWTFSATRYPAMRQLGLSLVEHLRLEFARHLEGIARMAPTLTSGSVRGQIFTQSDLRQRPLAFVEMLPCSLRSFEPWFDVAHEESRGPVESTAPAAVGAAAHSASCFQVPVSARMLRTSSTRSRLHNFSSSADV
jgi:hypothetical protein